MPYALISVTDKTGICGFARELLALGYQILSTGGTAKKLEAEGVELTRVSDYTSSPEILGGRVKTLHPKIHASILCDHSDKDHSELLSGMGGEAIHLVAGNLYDFRKAASEKQSLDKAMESIDIGGPTMLRGAAKNFRHCLAITNPDDYDDVLEFLNTKPTPGSDAWASYSAKYSAKTFAQISAYDLAVSQYFAGKSGDAVVSTQGVDLKLSEAIPLRYGENPKQSAAFFPLVSNCRYEPLQGKPLSYNNLLDVDAAAQIASEFGEPSDPDKTLCVAIVKHNNPCGAAIQIDGESTLDIFKRAYACDPISAFGGIIAINGELSLGVAKFIRAKKLFVECIVAGSFEKEALQELSARKNLRLLPWSQVRSEKKPALNNEIRSLHSGMLVQEWDCFDQPRIQTVTKLKPTDQQMRDLIFAAKIAKCTKSNTLIYAKNGATIAIGAGQMSRIDCVGLAVQKLQNSNQKNEGLCCNPLEFEGAVLASDAFFPFPDVAEESAKLGVKAIIQPGGSKRDELSIEACNRLGVSMVFSEERHFRH